MINLKHGVRLNLMAIDITNLSPVRQLLANTTIPNCISLSSNESGCIHMVGFSWVFPLWWPYVSQITDSDLYDSYVTHQETIRRMTFG